MRRIPVILQGTATDCGVVCLAMVLSSFGKRIQVKEVREQIRTGRDGASAADICSAAKAYGLDACGVEASVDDLRRLASPAILHWTGAHFVVFCGWKGSHAVIIDPLVGPIRASAELLEASFSGTALIFQKSPDFRTQSLPRRDWNRYLAPLKGSWRGISAAFALSLVLRSSTLILPSLTSDLVDRILPDRSTNGLRLVTIGLMLMVIIAGLGGVIRSAVLVRVRTRYEIGLMGSVIAHLLRLPLTYFEQRTSVDIFARTSSARAVRDILSQQLLAITSDVIFLCAYFALMLRISGDMTGAVIAVATTQIAIAYYSLRTLKPLLRNELHLQTRTQSYLVEVLRALETIKAATAESHIEHTWRKLHATQMGASCNRERIASFFAGATSTVDMSGPFVFLVLGAHLILSGRLSLGQLLGFNVLAACFLGPITSLVATVQGLQLVTVHLDRMDDVFDAEREPQCTGIRDDAWTAGLIELKHLSFRYSGSQRDALRDINLTVLSGKRIAIIGATGSGKSTLTKILSGLYLPTSGELLLGGVDARSVDLQAWRRGIGFVPQRMALFNDTIAGNIAFHSETVSKEQLAVAAHVVEIMDDIECMPGKFETILAEDGTNLSGGQRQRICIARAIVRRPKLLILDEATSELDADTERRIYANIARMGVTQVVVTHRLSSVFDADSIVVVHDGSIVEVGTHDELLNRGGHYGRMLRAYCGEAWAVATQAG